MPCSIMLFCGLITIRFSRSGTLRAEMIDASLPGAQPPHDRRLPRSGYRSMRFCAQARPLAATALPGSHPGRAKLRLNIVMLTQTACAWLFYVAAAKRRRLKLSLH